jgi:hypothetical protein
MWRIIFVNERNEFRRGDDDRNLPFQQTTDLVAFYPTFFDFILSES